MEYRIPKKGECYRHFKGDRYQVLAIARHSETLEEMVVYEGLYGEHPVYVRPLSMFVSKVDKEKFPNVEQEYRFQLEEDTAVNDAAEKSLILRFLELEDPREKKEFLQQVKTEVTGEFLEEVAESLDYVENAISLEERYQNIMKYLDTVLKYENRRLR